MDIDIYSHPSKNWTRATSPRKCDDDLAFYLGGLLYAVLAAEAMFLWHNSAHESNRCAFFDRFDWQAILSVWVCMGNPMFGPMPILDHGGWNPNSPWSLNRQSPCEPEECARRLAQLADDIHGEEEDVTNDDDDKDDRDDSNDWWGWQQLGWQWGWQCRQPHLEL